MVGAEIELESIQMQQSNAKYNFKHADVLFWHCSNALNDSWFKCLVQNHTAGRMGMAREIHRNTSNTSNTSNSVYLHQGNKSSS